MSSHLPKIIRRRSLNQASTDPAWSAILRRIYAGRGIYHHEELDYSLRHLTPYQSLYTIDVAVELLATALYKQQRFLIVADFDADGATSCAVAVRGLRLLGAHQVDYLVPDRFKHGYGLSPEIVALAAQFQPDILITVDNGISSVQGVAAAKALGIKVVITDHHLAGKILPAADAIINPNQPGDTFPSKNLAGVGVIFYLLLALRSRLRTDDWFTRQHIPEPNLAQLLDLVALGTVADVVKLDKLNRILVEQGLRRIRQGQCCAGINALIQVAKRDQTTLPASDLGFYLGPRINAAGRIEHMTWGIQCLLADEPGHALELAAQLDNLNEERKVLEQTMRAEALAALQTMHLEDTQLPLGICLFDPHWHEGVIGLLASKVKDTYHRPVIILTASQEQPQYLKGSCRSIAEVHIRDILADLNTRHPGMLVKFGGHAMAAGLTLHREALKNFSQLFAQSVTSVLNGQCVEGVIDTDGELEAQDFSLEFAYYLRSAQPWGQGFPEPIFDGVFALVERRVLKDRHLKLRLRLPGKPMVLDAIAFHTTDHHWPTQVDAVRMAYRLDINQFRGHTCLQLLVEYVEPVIT